MTDQEWSHPERVADRYRGVLQLLDQCSPLNAPLARNAAAAIRELLESYRFLDSLLDATAQKHLAAHDQLREACWTLGELLSTPHGSEGKREAENRARAILARFDGESAQ